MPRGRPVGVRWGLESQGCFIANPTGKLNACMQPPHGGRRGRSGAGAVRVRRMHAEIRKHAVHRGWAPLRARTRSQRGSPLPARARASGIHIPARWGPWTRPRRPGCLVAPERRGALSSPSLEATTSNTPKKGGPSGGHSSAFPCALRVLGSGSRTWQPLAMEARGGGDGTRL